MPVGAQIVGRYRGEADLLTFAAAWKTALAISSRRPTLAHADTPVRPQRPTPSITTGDRNTVDTGEEMALTTVWIWAELDVCHAR